MGVEDSGDKVDSRVRDSVGTHLGRVIDDGAGGGQEISGYGRVVNGVVRVFGFEVSRCEQRLFV